MKKLIKAAWRHDKLDPGHVTKALLQYCNTPSQCDHLSPAQKLFGQPIQDIIPAHRRDLPELSFGSKVAIQNSHTKLWDVYGTITAIGPYRRYYIKTAGGRVLTRNRCYIRRRFPVVPPESQHTPQPTPVPPPPPVPTPPRRSSRPHTRPPRLIEEIGST